MADEDDDIDWYALSNGLSTVMPDGTLIHGVDDTPTEDKPMPHFAPRDVLTTLQKLPPYCATVLNSDTSLVIGIRRGERGYTELRRKPNEDEARAFADHINRNIASKAQVAAMEAGSIFGWEVPGADPDMYEADGAPKRRTRAAG